MATHALFVRDGGQIFGIASHTVRTAVPAVAVQLERENGALFARVDDVRYPAHELASLTGLRGASSPERRNLVLVDSESGPIGVLVDAVLEASELVTRPTGRYLKRIPGVAGIGLTGNGSVIPLLDIAELARTPRDQAMRAAAEARSQAQRSCAARACSSSTTPCRCAAPSRRCSKTMVTTSRSRATASKPSSPWKSRVPTCCSPISKCPT